MKKNLTESRGIIRVILGVTLIAVVWSALAVNDHQSHRNPFIKRIQKHFETLKDDWKCLLDRKKRCMPRQKARITAELIILATLIAPLFYKGVQWRRRTLREEEWRTTEAQSQEIEEARRAEEEPLKKSVQELKAALISENDGAIRRLLESSNKQEIIDGTLKNLSRSFTVSLLANPDTNRAIKKLITDYFPSKEAIGAALIAIAEKSDAPDLVTLLLQQEPTWEDINAALSAASTSPGFHSLAIIKELIDQGHASVDYQGRPYGNTPLHAAVHQIRWPTGSSARTIERRKKIIRYLLSSGVNLHAKNLRGERPWDIASPEAKELIKNEIRRRHAVRVLRQIGPIQQGDAASRRRLSEEEIAYIMSFLPGQERPVFPPSDEKIIDWLRHRGDWLRHRGALP